MRGLVHAVAILLMIVWSVIVLIDIAIGFSVPPGTTEAIVAGVTPDQLTQYYSDFRLAFLLLASPHESSRGWIATTRRAYRLCGRRGSRDCAMVMNRISASVAKSPFQDAGNTLLTQAAVRTD